MWGGSHYRFYCEEFIQSVRHVLVRDPNCKLYNKIDKAHACVRLYPNKIVENEVGGEGGEEGKAGWDANDISAASDLASRHLVPRQVRNKIVQDVHALQRDHTPEGSMSDPPRHAQQARGGVAHRAHVLQEGQGESHHHHKFGHP